MMTQLCLSRQSSSNRTAGASSSSAITATMKMGVVTNSTISIGDAAAPGDDNNVNSISDTAAATAADSDDNSVGIIFMNTPKDKGEDTTEVKPTEKTKMTESNYGDNCDHNNGAEKSDNSTNNKSSTNDITYRQVTTLPSSADDGNINICTVTDNANGNIAISEPNDNDKHISRGDDSTTDDRPNFTGGTKLNDKDSSDDIHQSIDITDTAQTTDTNESKKEGNGVLKDEHQHQINNNNIAFYNATDKKNAILNHIQKQSDHTRSWHMEILSELFLTCGEQELKHLDNQSSFVTLSTNVSATTNPNTNVTTSALEKGDKTMETSSSKNKTLNHEHETTTTTHHINLRKRKRCTLNEKLLKQQQGNNILYKYHFHPQPTPSHFPIFSHILKRFKIKYDQHQRDLQSNTDNDIQEVGGTRNNLKPYIGRTQKQLERAVLKKFRDRVLSKKSLPYTVYGTEVKVPLFQYRLNQRKDNTIATGVGDETSSNMKDDRIYESISLLYNECSVAAISKWAIPACGFIESFVPTNVMNSTTDTERNNHADVTKSDSNDNNETNTSNTNKETDDKNESSKKNEPSAPRHYRNKHKNQYLKRVSHVPVASATFRRCMACFKFGHYEVECEHIAQKRMKKAVELSHWLYKETMIQNLLRDFASPFHIDNVKNNINNSNASRLVTSEESGDEDDEPFYRHDVPQDLNLVTQKQKNMSSHSYICVSLDEKDKEEHLASSSSTQNAHQNIGFGYKPEDESRLQYDGCQICKSKYNAQQLLVCDGCDKLYHKQCLDPPLNDVPEGDWFCIMCNAYESDVSSVVEIEGIDDFVIEQRKLHSNDITKRDEDGDKIRNIKFSIQNDQWDASVTVIPRKSSLHEDMEEFAKKCEQRQPTHALWSDETGQEIELSVGELCFAKRAAAMASLKALYSRDIYWPAMVVRIHDSNIAFDGSIQTKYIVKFFALSGSGRVRASHIVPFFPNFEHLGYKPLQQQREKEWYDNFRRGILESISLLGVKTPYQALVKAREIIAGSKVDPPTEETESNYAKENRKATNAHRRILGEDSEITIIDNFVIVAHKNEASSVGKIDASAPELSVVPKEKEEKDAKNYATNELLGGIVCFCIDSNDKLDFGVLSGIDERKRRVLVRIISNLDKVIQAVHHQTLSDEYNSKIDEISSDNSTKKTKVEELFDIYACNIGATIWVPISSLIHLSDGLKMGESAYSSSVINGVTSKLRDCIVNNNRMQHEIREDQMVTNDKSANIDGFQILFDDDDVIDESSESSQSDSDFSSHLSSTSEDDMSVSHSSSMPFKGGYESDENTDDDDVEVGGDSVENSHDNKYDNKHDDVDEKERDDDDNDDDEDEDIDSPSKALVISPSNSAGTCKGIFTVEKILNDRINKYNPNMREFLIKWKGFDDSENTWETEKNILDTNVLRKYLAHKLLTKLQITPEAKDENSITSRIVKVIEAGIHIMETSLVIYTHKNKRNMCPFCFQEFAIFGMAPHVKLVHHKAENFELIRQVSKIADLDWYNKAEEQARNKQRK